MPCDSRWRKQQVLYQTGQNVGGDCSCCSRDPCCTGPPGGATSTRTSWPNDLTISRLANGCSFCTQAGSAMRKLVWPCTGSGGGTLNRMRWRDELPVPSLLYKWVSCRQAARHWKVLLLRQAVSKLAIPSVTQSGVRHVPGILFLVTYWSISRRFLFELEEFQFVVNLRTSRKGAGAGPSGMTSDHLRALLDQVWDSHLLFLLGDQLAIWSRLLHLSTTPSGWVD